MMQRKMEEEFLNGCLVGQLSRWDQPSENSLLANFIPLGHKLG
jgi:hypothetical protein